MSITRRRLVSSLALLIATQGPAATAAPRAARILARGGSAPTTARQVFPARPRAEIPTLPRALIATPAIVPAPPAAAEITPQDPSVRLERMTDQVGALLTASESNDQASHEDSRGLASGVFNVLAGGSDADHGTAPEQSGPLSIDTAVDATEATLTQRKMILTLYQIASIFDEQYGPIDFKKNLFTVDLKREYNKVREAILANPRITTQEFQDLLAAFALQMRDYHVSVTFDSTEKANLPFLITEAGGKHFLSHINRKALPLKIFPFRVGDEVLSFDGKPTAEAIDQLARDLMGGGNTAETDRRLAEIFLTNRRRARGDAKIPNGNVTMVIRGRNNRAYEVQMPWKYVPEIVPQDVPVRDSGLLDFRASRPSADGPSGVLGRAFTNAAHPLAETFRAILAEDADNPFMPGARKSFVPRLGKVLWETETDNPFHAYIFQMSDGKKAGYIRIPSYDGNSADVARFGKIMAKFQKETSALVIDQVNNPGGSIFYLYALASHLTDKPLLTPRHRLVIGQDDGQQAAELLLQIAQGGAAGKALAQEDEDEDEWSGYPVTEKFMLLTIQFAKFILRQLQAGKRFTDPTHLWGVDDIDPSPRPAQNYTKPILLLTNALDFSGGDFFPAIMQDSKRALLIGVGTAGAGGAVKPYAPHNQFGIRGMTATWTIAQRANGQPIENLRVLPDIHHDFTAKDLRSGFSDYKQGVLAALAGLIDSR